MFRLFGLLSLAVVLNLSAPAEPIINEFLASNLSVHPDNCDFEDYSDWIELHNPAGTNVSLVNYYLTDDLAEPFKWLIPTNAVIPANGYLMIRADGHNAAVGETHHWPYWPWNVNILTRRFHSNFKLSADGEAVGLYRTDLAPVDVTFIPANAMWRYLDAGTNPPTLWASPAYDDSSWLQGAAQLGYGDGDEATVVGFGPNSSAKYPTTHFRHHFNVTDPTRIGNIRFRVIVDDGAVFYLNGTEFARLRMAEGAIAYSDYANAQPPVENAFEVVELPGKMLQAGDNVLAVEVHQENASSSDISWAAELIASEISGPAILVDSVAFGPQTTDVSYGRNATNGWSFFGTPTPEGPNNTAPLTQLSYATATTATLPSGFYASAQVAGLSAAGADEIRYTLDGSVPGPASTLYSSALNITTNTVLRARAFTAGLIPGPILTRSYFVGEPTDRTLPVISLVADPATLFDSTIGIYDNDTPNVYKGREVPVRTEFFETNGNLGFAVNGGIRIGGENIWRFAQKPLNLYLRSKYGDDLINYQVFPDEPVGTFGRLNIRNGGDNWALDMLRDALIAPVLQDRGLNDLSSYRPVALFLNGQYWGIHNIRKQFDPLFFANEHVLPEGEYDLVQYAHNGFGVTTLMADTGSVESYENFQTFFTTHNLSQPTNYATMQALMNVDSFIDYVAANDFGVNTSWSHNREFWCGRTPSSKWHWNVPDFDRCFDSPNLGSSLIDDYRSSYNLFQALDDNTNFVNRLLQRYAAHLGSTFHSNRVSAILDTLSAEVDNEMPRHIAKWASSGGIPSLASRQAQLDEIKQFTIARPAFAVSQLQTQLGISRGMANLAVTIAPVGGGTIRIAGVPIIPELNTDIGLFLNTPVEITADPAPGYKFVSWSTGSTNPTIELTMPAAQSLTANFQAGAETVLPAVINANTTLSLANSPYTLTNDLIVVSNVTLAVDAGVKFLLPPKAGITVYGALQVNGTSNAPVEMLPRDASRPWGNLSFVNATGNSVLSNLTIRGASASRVDPVNLKAAVSGYNSTIALDGADIETLFPVFTRFGSTTMRNSRIHILFTGDGINIKAGAGLVENCIFTGEATPDTDAIDFDNVVNGVIRGNRIYAFRGSNSDGIDVGEGCVNLLVSSNRIFNMFDKGVSVGQASVARIERNLIVNCDIGIGVKDFNSTAYVDQNTFAHDNVGVAVYEKNLGNGGGIAYVTNSIFYRSKDAPVTVDVLSVLTVDYSISDTLPLTGTGNLLQDPLFTDAGNYDFSLTSGSPAINTGDPAHPLDGDGSRADMGAYYIYSPADYPYLVPNLVVVNEVMSHSHNAEPDWIELHNNSAQDLDIGGWYLSDDSNVPLKYRIADGTILPANGYRVFYESLHFGAASLDRGALIPFALSENGEEVNIYGPTDGFRPDYNEKEDFGPAATGVSFGRYFKASTSTYNFVAMVAPTPGAPNSAPLVGPIVISEIMYHPPVADAEYLELVNISNAPVTLYEALTSEPWKMQGITHVFPVAPPLTMAAGERILLVRNSTIFAQNYTPAPGTRVFQWTSGGLDNNGETLEIVKPGDTNSLGVRQYIRVDHVDFTDAAPWPTGPDGSGTSLARINEQGYGNDVANWSESPATPGETGFEQWVVQENLPDGLDGPEDDADGDGLKNGLEYAVGTSPSSPSTLTINWDLNLVNGIVQVEFTLGAHRPDVQYLIQKTDNPASANWTNMNVAITSGASSSFVFSAADAAQLTTGFYRLAVVVLNQ